MSKMIGLDATSCAGPAVRCPCRKPLLVSCRLPKHVVKAFSFQAKAFQASATDKAPQRENKSKAKKEQVPRRPNIPNKRQESPVPKKVPTSGPRLHIRAYRKEALLQRRTAELEEEANKIDLDPAKLLNQGDPSSVQAVVKEINPVGLFLAMPNDKEGFLPSTDFGFSGGVVILQRLFTVGQVLTVKVVRNGGGGREIVSMRKEQPVEV